MEGRILPRTSTMYFEIHEKIHDSEDQSYHAYVDLDFSNSTIGLGFDGGRDVA